MAEREYDCVDCGRSHVASRWYVRQATLVGSLLKTDYLCGDATGSAQAASGVHVLVACCFRGGGELKAAETFGENGVVTDTRLDRDLEAEA